MEDNVSYNTSDIVNQISRSLGVRKSIVRSTLKTFTGVCSSYVGLGYSFNLCEDIYMRVSFRGSKSTGSTVVVPTRFLFAETARRSGISTPLVEGILTRVFDDMIRTYLSGGKIGINGLIRFNPKANKNYNKISYGSWIDESRHSNNYLIRMIYSHRLGDVSPA